MSKDNEIYKKVLDYFEGNKHKTEMWFNTLNPALGIVKPKDMTTPAKINKLERFIDEAIEKNKLMGGSMTRAFNKIGVAPKSKTKVTWAEPEDNTPQDDGAKPAFKLYDPVIKTTGDYRFEGVVVGVIEKVTFDLEDELVPHTGQFRYVVQNTDGLLHIFSKAQLDYIEY